MPAFLPVAGEVAHQMALLPVVWLALLWVAGTPRGAAWWWIAGAFGVSWLADTAAHWVNPWLASAVYPVTQAAVIGAVFLHRDDARVFLTLLVLTGLVSTALRRTPDILLHTVAWGGIVAAIWPLPAGKLRTALLVAFGGGWLAWLGYNLVPGWPSWLAFQGVRALSLGLFCVAAWHPAPRLRLA